jgi:hypothetical protein
MTKMKTNSPTHETIARRAREIWTSRGAPGDCDTEIWLEAERQLTAGSPPESHAGVLVAGTPATAESAVVAVIPGPAGPVAGGLNAGSLPDPDAVAAQAAVQKRAARAPQVRHGKNAPRAAPTESGKPLWDKPHSS